MAISNNLLADVVFIDVVWAAVRGRYRHAAP
jgi:hypothetical protein